MGDRLTLSHSFKILFYARQRVVVSSKSGNKKYIKSSIFCPLFKTFPYILVPEETSVLIETRGPTREYKRYLCIYLIIGNFIMENVRWIRQNSE